jgi:hypothetical protein
VFVRIYLQHAGMLYIDSSAYVLAIYGLLTCSSFEPLQTSLFTTKTIISKIGSNVRLFTLEKTKILLYICLALKSPRRKERV